MKAKILGIALYVIAENKKEDKQLYDWSHKMHDNEIDFQIIYSKDKDTYEKEYENGVMNAILKIKKIMKNQKNSISI